MRFDTAQAVENVVWQMRLADFPRAQNRALIDSLANGAPPYTMEEQVQNRITTNVNFLELTNIAHSARRQYANAFLNVDPPFNVTVDYGPKWKRREWSSGITKALGRIMKRSLPWYEMRRNVFASNVMHGIGPSVYNDRHSWCHSTIAIGDVLVPADTLLTLENLPFFAVYRRYTPMQLIKATQGPRIDPGWNLKLAKQAIKWADDKARTLMGLTWPSFWSPEKMEERIKSDGALYASDAVPTIDTYDVYYWSEDKKQTGWRRRMVIDAWGSPGPGVGGTGASLPDKNMIGTRGEFLYDGGDRVYARNISEIVHWQFADVSCSSPFNYHSVRSLGFLLYAVCHLQNRLHCKFNDAVFESLLQYFRISNPQDAERMTQVNLIDKGIIPEGLEFVKAGERWQVNDALAQQAMALNRQSMADNSVSFTQDYDFGSEQNREETATRTNAKITATAALVGAMLNQAYKYEEFRYTEIARRFCIKHSKDQDVRKFRVQMLKKGVPEEALNHECWDVVANKVIGSGDKQLQVAIAEALMRIRPLLDPAAQKRIDQIYISAHTDDYELTAELVPAIRGPSKSQELATFAAGTLMQGMKVIIEEGIDHRGYVEALLANMGVKIQSIEQSGGMATLQDITGLENMAQHIVEQIQLIAQDPTEKARVKQYGDDLGQLMNMVKAYRQRLEEQMQAAAEQQGQGGDPKDAAKVQAMLIQAQTKSEIATQSAAQRTAQRQVQFETKLAQDQAKHQAELDAKAAEHAQNLAATNIETANKIRQEELKPQKPKAEK